MGVCALLAAKQYCKILNRTRRPMWTVMYYWCLLVHALLSDGSSGAAAAGRRGSHRLSLCWLCMSARCMSRGAAQALLKRRRERGYAGPWAAGKLRQTTDYYHSLERQMVISWLAAVNLSSSAPHRGRGGAVERTDRRGEGGVRGGKYSMRQYWWHGAMADPRRHGYDLEGRGTTWRQPTPSHLLPPCRPRRPIHLKHIHSHPSGTRPPPGT